MGYMKHVPEISHKGRVKGKETRRNLTPNLPKRSTDTYAYIIIPMPLRTTCVPVSGDLSCVGSEHLEDKTQK